MSMVLASAADARYGYWLLNLVGSAAANAKIFDGVVLYDLGLTPHQRRLASSIRGVELREIPPFAPHWRAFFTWKPWIWTHLDADEIVWLDAGTTVLRPLTTVADEIRERGYVLVSQQSPLSDILPHDYYELYGIPVSTGERDYVAAGVIGFATTGAFFDQVLLPTHEDCLRGLNLGYSADEAALWSWGLNREAPAIVRDCPRFRHDQTVLNANLVRAMPDAHVNDLFRFAGPRSPRDHPEQLIWHHRRRGDFAHLTRVPYVARAAPLGLAWGLQFRTRWWIKNRRWLFAPGTYLRKARRIAASPFAR
jgi:hypothetical protein